MLLPKKSRFERICEYLHIDEIAPELFSASLIAYLFAYLFEQLLPGIVSFGISLDVLLWVMIVFGIIFAMVNRDEFEQAQQESFELHNIKLPSVIFLVAISAAGFLAIYEKTKTVVSSSLAISILSAIIIFGLGIFVMGESKKEKKNISRVEFWTRKLSFSAIVLLALWCAFSFLVPTGSLTFRIDPMRHSRYITEFAKKETQILKVQPDLSSRMTYRVITQNPLQFNLSVPRFFNRAEVKVTYKPMTLPQPVTIGIKNKNGKMVNAVAADYQPLLESMPAIWQKISGTEYDVWIRNKPYEQALKNAEKKLVDQESAIQKKFDADVTRLNAKLQLGDISRENFNSSRENLQDKLSNDLEAVKTSESIDPAKFHISYSNASVAIQDANVSFSRIGAYHVATDTLFNADKIGSFQYAASYDQQASMRGGYSLLGYMPADGKMSVSFVFVDSNRHDGGDPVTVTISQNGKTLASKKVNDDGDNTPDKFISPEKTVTIDAPEVLQGIVHIEVVTNDDIFTKHLSSTLPYLGFKNFFYGTDSESYKNIIDKSGIPITVYIATPSVSFVTTHKEGLQDIQVNRKAVKLSKVNEPVTVSGLKGITKLVLQKGDVRISGDGIFSLQEFSPLLMYSDRSVTALSSASQLDSYDLLIANYIPAEKEGDWLVAHATIAKSNLGYPGHMVTVAIDFGSLGLDSRTVAIKDIQVTLTKDPITLSKIIAKIRGYFK